MTKGIENKSNIVPVDGTVVDTIKEATENAMLSRQRLSELYGLFGKNGIDELVKIGAEELSVRLSWSILYVWALKRGCYPGIFHPNGKK